MATLERFGPTGHDLVVLDERRGRMSLGKNPDNDLVISDDGAVSRVHAVLEVVGPTWCITDLGSTNGTTVNGERILSARTLADRDEIVLGRTRMIIHHLGGGDDATTDRLRPAPQRTPREQEVLIELCRPILSGQAFTPPASVKAIAAALFVGEGAVKQHLDHLYDKFLIEPQAGESRRVLLANLAIQTAAVTMRDLQTPERR
jgi:hypothetical protein